MQIVAVLQETIPELWDLKCLKMGLNLHANMEGFLQSQSHISYYYNLIQFVFLYFYYVATYLHTHSYVAICDEFNCVEINWSGT